MKKKKRKEEETMNKNVRLSEGRDQFSNSRLLVGVAWSPGGRDYMQDSFCLVLNHEKDEEIDFLGVFDGHGTNGENVSRFVAQNICDVVMNKATQPAAEGEQKKVDFCQAISQGCLELDEKVRTNESLMRDDRGRVMGGTTACAAWFRREHIYCANAGDSRMVISAMGEACTVTDDHKPNMKEEKLRILKAGGYVSNDRVMETLAVARSFGDFSFKERANLGARDQMVTALPDITIVKKVEDIDFIVLATDGVWDVMTNQQVVDFVREDFVGRKDDDIAGVCARLLDRCKAMAKRMEELMPTQDNMTVMVAIMK